MRLYHTRAVDPGCRPRTEGLSNPGPPAPATFLWSALLSKQTPSHAWVFLLCSEEEETGAPLVCVGRRGGVLGDPAPSVSILSSQLPPRSWACRSKIRPTAPSPSGGRPLQTHGPSSMYTGSSGPAEAIPRGSKIPKDSRTTRRAGPTGLAIRWRRWCPGLGTASVCGPRAAVYTVPNRASMHPRVRWGSLLPGGGRLGQAWGQ